MISLDLARLAGQFIAAALVLAVVVLALGQEVRK